MSQNVIPLSKLIRIQATLWTLVSIGLASACQSSALDQCGDFTCPASTVCTPSGDSCVSLSQVSSCADRADLTECSYQGEPNGICIDQVCYPAGCGNAQLEDGEVCDDGNRLHGDGCSADCQSDETCGNGHIDLEEDCDNGGVGGNGCDSQCLFECLPGSRLYVFAGSIETFTMPSSCPEVRITASGAQGGGGGGLGATMAGSFVVSLGSELSILVGEQGFTDAGALYGHSGGGGSFVIAADNTPLVVAGGGGGGNRAETGEGGPGLTTTTGGNNGDGLVLGGTDGAGGGRGSVSGVCGGTGSGGGGFLGNGEISDLGGGVSFANGGAGGSGDTTNCVTENRGGFGGGGAAGTGGGGGGGFSGGGGGQDSGSMGRTAGGGGSVNNGTDQANAGGARSGNGEVTLSW